MKPKGHKTGRKWQRIERYMEKGVGWAQAPVRAPTRALNQARTRHPLQPSEERSFILLSENSHHRSILTRGYTTFALSLNLSQNLTVMSPPTTSKPCLRWRVWLQRASSPEPRASPQKWDVEASFPLKSTEGSPAASMRGMVSGPSLKKGIFLWILN